ncbi:MAG: DUF11 domain-containing protein [Thermoflexales bacterium]|nr:DUF11 domain-containing protein [Thermoflexales bacterium]
MHKQKLWRGLVLGSFIALVVAVFASAQSGPLPSRRLTAPDGPGGKATGVIPEAKPYGVEVVSAEAFGTIKSLADVPDVPRSPRPSDDDAAVLPKYQQNGPASYQIDSRLQTKPGALDSLGSPIANFAGMGITEAGGFLPPDTQGDIGYDSSSGKRYYFQWVNVTYKVWDVTNPAAPSVVISTTQGNALWAAALPGSECALRNHGDPITLFDEQAGRWMISQFALGASYSGPFHQCIAVSQTANPTGAWNVYDFPYRNATTYLNDYPHFGVWPDATYNAYYMTVHQFNASGTAWLGQAAAAYDRAKILAGDPTAQAVYFDLYSVNSNFGGMLPADLDGTPPPTGTPGLFFEVDDNTAGMGADALRVWELRPNWTIPAASTFGISGQPNYTVTVASFNLPPCTATGTRTCIPQPGTTQKLDVIGDRLMYRAAFRTVGSTQSVMLNHTVWADGTDRVGVRWYEARRNPADGSWSIYQQGTYAPADGQYRWMGSIAMDVSGNIALGYSASSSTVSSTIRYAGRVVSDSLNTLPQTEITLVTSLGSQTHTAARWGDYSMMGVDPADGCTFWYTQEYHGATASSAWQTRIGSFKFSECTLGSTGNLSGTVRNAATNNPIASAAVTAISSSGGSYPAASDASGRYQILSLPIGTYTVTASAGGYNSSLVAGVSITTGITTTQDLALTALPQADVSLIKTASASQVGPSGSLAYTLTVTNNGPDAITTTVTLTDALPSGYTLGTATGTGWSCSGTTTVVCTRTGLGIGASASINLNGTAPISLGTITNTATVGANAYDPAAANNIATATTTIVPQTDLAVTKTGPASAAPGATLVYTLTVTNNGPVSIGQSTQTLTNATAFTITDNAAASLYPSPIVVAGGGMIQKVTARLLGITHTYPSDVDIILVSPSGAKSWLMSDVIGDTNISSLNFTFDDSAASTIGCPTVATPVSGTYKPTDCSDANTDVFPAPAPTGPYTPNLALFNNTDPTGTWNLYVRDDAGIDTGRLGGWSLTLLTGYAGPITVTDALPAGSTYVGASGSGWTCSHASGIVTCIRSALSVGAAPSILITTTAPLTTGVITNTALVTSSLSDSTPANNTAQFATTLTSGGPTYGVSVSPSTAGQSGLAGTSVTYTLNVTNTGTASDSFTVTLSGNAFTTTAPATVGPLGAGASTTLNVVVTIPAGAAGGASDTVNVKVTSQADPSKFATAALTTTANTVRGVTVTPGTVGQSGLPGAIVTYTLSVTNTGEASDTFTVTLSGNAFVTNAPASIGPLAAGANTTLNVVVTIPAGAAGGASDAANVKITSRGDPSKFVNSTLTTTANSVRGVAMTPGAVGQSGLPGAVVTYTLSVTNTGNASDTYTVTISGNAFVTNAPASIGPLAAGANTTLNVVVTIPVGAAGGAVDAANVKITSQGDPSKFANSTLTTTANTLRGVAVTPGTLGQSGLPGAVVTYTLSVTNTGNAADTFAVTITGNAFGTTAPLAVGPLAAGASSILEVAVTIPAGTPAGTSDTATLTVKSQGNNAITADATLTTAVWYGVFLPIVLFLP